MEQSSAKPPWQGWHKTVCSTAWEGSLGWELCSGCQDPRATQCPIKREIYAAPFRLFSVNTSMYAYRDIERVSVVLGEKKELWHGQGTTALRFLRPSRCVAQHPKALAKVRVPWGQRTKGELGWPRDGGNQGKRSNFHFWVIFWIKYGHKFKAICHSPCLVKSFEVYEWKILNKAK